MVVLRIFCLSGLILLESLAGAALAQISTNDILRLGGELLRLHEQQRIRQAPQPQTRRPQYRDRNARRLPQQRSAPRAPAVDRSQLAEVQALLNEMGHDAGAVDGGMGPRTRRAISDFQRDAGMAPTGHPDSELLAVLRATRQMQSRGQKAYSDGGASADAAPFAPPSGGEGAFTLLQGYDLPYGDYRSGTTDPQLRNISSADCQWLCAADGRCRSFTYNARAQVCILKETVPQGVPFAGAVSGIKVAGTVAPTMGGMAVDAGAGVAEVPGEGPGDATPGARAQAPAGPAEAGGRLVAPALEGAPIASPAAAVPIQEVADGGLRSHVNGPEGLVICSKIQIWPVTRELVASKIAATFSARDQLEEFLKSQGYDYGINEFGIPPDATEIAGVVKVLGQSVAFFDRNVLVDGGPMEIGSFGIAMRAKEMASFCKLVVETSVCAKKLSASERDILGCKDQQARAAPQSTGDRPQADALQIAEPQQSKVQPPAPAGKWVAPAPTGAPITSGPAVGPAAPAQRAQPVPPPPASPAPAPNAGGFDPLAPEGISVGMTGKEAKAALEASGYKFRGTPLHGFSFDKKGKTDRKLWFRTIGGYSEDALDKPVNGITYEQVSPDYDLAGVDFSNLMSERIGARPGCQILRDTIVICSWLSPPNAPLVKEIGLEFKIAAGGGSETLIAISVVAVDELEERVPAPAVPAPSVLSNEARDFDPIAPEGITIGMEMSAVEATLKANGLTRSMPIDCNFRDQHYYDDPSAKGRRVSISLGEPDSFNGWAAASYCEPGKIVVSLGYERRGFDSGGAYADFAEELGKKFGASGKCSENDWQMACEWNEPPNAPLYGTVQLVVKKKDGNLALQIWAVQDILKRVSLPPPPVEEKHWWDEELAAWEAISEKFSGSEKFAGLSADLQSRFRGEAAQVFDYCKGRETYAALNDCRCVAGKLIDARVSQEATNKADIHDLVAIAQKAAEGGQCPHKAGAAKYAYENCVSTHKNIIPETYKKVCGCYADVSAAVYENAPAGSFNDIKRAGVFAIQECEKQGFAFRPRE
jgi:peptidoglycan hydrolase-like protein with peptidoglycan-binding domain